MAASQDHDWLKSNWKSWFACFRLFSALKWLSSLSMALYQCARWSQIGWRTSKIGLCAVSLLHRILTCSEGAAIWAIPRRWLVWRKDKCRLTKSEAVWMRYRSCRSKEQRFPLIAPFVKRWDADSWRENRCNEWKWARQHLDRKLFAPRCFQIHEVRSCSTPACCAVLDHTW